MYRTLDKGLKGFRANLKPENRPWGLFVSTVVDYLSVVRDSGDFAIAVHDLRRQLASLYQ